MKSNLRSTVFYFFPPAVLGIEKQARCTINQILFQYQLKVYPIISAPFAFQAQ